MPLIATGFGDDTGGGLFLYDGAGVEQLDDLSSTSMCTAGDRAARFLRGPIDGIAGSELLIYDRGGIVRYVRLDGVPDPHDVVWTGETFIVASAGANALFWLSPSGDPVREWRAPGEGDAWHLNGLLVDGERLVVCAFGRSSTHRGWQRADGGTGIVFSLETGEDILTGLTAPTIRAGLAAAGSSATPDAVSCWRSTRPHRVRPPRRRPQARIRNQPGEARRASPPRALGGARELGPGALDQ